MPKRVVTYAHVSGDDRHTEGGDLQGQIETCRHYAAEHGYEIVSELAEADRGASGAAFELPELNRGVDLARAGALHVLVIRELDRLSRNLLKQLLVEDDLKWTGIAVEYVLGEYPDTPEGRLNMHASGGMAGIRRDPGRRVPQAAVARGCVSRCPQCNAPMVLRTASRGPNQGGQFWGCPNYSRCRGVLKYEPLSAQMPS